MSAKLVTSVLTSTLGDEPRLAMRWRAELVAGLGRQDDQFTIVLDITRVFASDQALLTESPLAEAA